ncbi:hypothetical protein HRbin11_02185 [bacterium HR11]|nr:hypothetical protein HRbin11_02185 [bacterium HR11]
MRIHRFVILLSLALGPAGGGDTWAQTRSCIVDEMQIRLLSPSNGAAGVTTTPTLDWEDVPWAMFYDVQVCTDSFCLNVIRSVTGLTASQWTVSPPLEPGQTYYWQVRASDPWCETWSEVWSFTTLAYILTVNRVPVTGGTVTSSPAGIDCGTTCSASFGPGTTVTLTATPAGGWQLAGWAGCDSTNSTQCMVTMNADRAVQVNFSCIPVGTPSLLSPANGLAGVSTTPLLDWSDIAEAAFYEVQVCADSACGTVVRSQTGLTASQWAVSPALAFGTTYYWRVRAASACTTGVWTAPWIFTTQPPPSHTLTVIKNEAIGGTVTSSPAGIDCGTTCSASFVDGTTVTLTATPAGGWQFGSWTGCDTTNGNQCAVTMTSSGDRTITANFTTCPGKPWSWGAYDWLSCPALTLTDISNVVMSMAARGFRGFRTFINAYFGPYSLV